MEKDEGKSNPMRTPDISGEPDRAGTSEPRRLDGLSGVYELTSAVPVFPGRLSEFYPARDVRSNSAVLIKSFRYAPDEQFAIGAFYEELNAIRQLRHPNILEVLDYNSGGGLDAPPFLVLPWCRGGNLRELQERTSADFLPLSSVISILEQVASAIDYAHQNGVIHGDIKPENILLSEDRRHAFLADFGMAKFFDVQDRVRVSQPALPRKRRGQPAGQKELDRGALARGGTSAYLSPEQLADNKQSPRSDIYSFALVVYELLTGRLPFDVAAPLYRQIHARVTGDLMDPGDANPSLAAAGQGTLRFGLATNPRERPASAAELCSVLTGAAPVPKAFSHRRSMTQSKVPGWWKGLPPVQKAGVITAAIVAAGGIVKAIVEITPLLLGLGGK